MKEESGRDVLYRGIASRAFERRFQLADHVEVTGASLENGLLHIDLVREIPEAMKPRKIAIGGGRSRSRSTPRPPDRRESEFQSAPVFPGRFSFQARSSVRNASTSSAGWRTP